MKLVYPESMIPMKKSPFLRRFMPGPFLRPTKRDLRWWEHIGNIQARSNVEYRKPNAHPRIVEAYTRGYNNGLEYSLGIQMAARNM
jgi:hypothetical protein